MSEVIYSWLPNHIAADIDWDGQASDPRTLQLLIALIIHTQPKVIVEAGTYRGAFAVMAAYIIDAAHLDAHITTAEINADNAGRAFELALKHGLTKHITLYHGRFEDMLKIVDKPIDFAYIDAGTRPKLIAAVAPKMAPNGLIVVDDAAPGQQLDRVRKKLLEYNPFIVHGARGTALIRV